MRRVFSEHSREIDYQTGSLWFATRPQQGLPRRFRQGTEATFTQIELIEQVSSKLFEKTKVGDIVPPLAHSLPHATLTEDDNCVRPNQPKSLCAPASTGGAEILTENTRQR